MRRVFTIAALGLAILTLAADRAPVTLTAAAARRVDVVLRTDPHDPCDLLTGFEHDSSRAVWTTDIPSAGVYDVRLKYRSPAGKKMLRMCVGGQAFESPLAPSTDFRSEVLGRVDLTAEPVEVAIEKGDGWFDVAEVGLAPSRIQPPPQPPGIPCDPAAAAAAKTLLKNLCAGIGRYTLTGGYGTEDEKLVTSLTGKRPAIFGADLMDFSPSRVQRGARPPQLTEDLIRRSHQGQIITLCWHWNAPAGLIDKVIAGPDGKIKDCRWYRGFYTDATTFDVEAALADPDSESYRLLLRDIDAIAVPLQQLSDAGIPVLWRPLHEAEGKWFWWGAKGPEPFKKLWRLTYDRLVRVHGLHNLIWVFTNDTARLSSTPALAPESSSPASDPAWYPGDDVVDIVGIDAYPKNPHDVMAGHWIEMSSGCAGRKPLAMTECGGVADVPAMYRLGCPWAYFISWTGDEGPKKTLPADLMRIYADPHARSLEIEPR